MKKRTLFIIAITISVFCILIIGFIKGENSSARETNGNKKANKIPKVRVITVEESKISEILELTGSVAPYRVARLSSPAEGPVENLRVRESDVVKSGEELLSIGRKKGIHALIVSLKEELKKEEDNLDRTRRLVEKEALPGEMLDQARTKCEKARASLIKAEETARDYEIRAPWKGVVSRVNVREGEYVAPRSQLLEIYDPESLVIRCAVPEKHAAGVFSGMTARIRLDAYRDSVFGGRIERVYPYLDERSRTRTIEVVLNKDVKLLPGMFARLKIALEHDEKGLTVPSEALINRPGGQIVLVLEKGKASARKVETGMEEKNRVQIISGIKKGEKVIVAGNGKLKNGAKVIVEKSGAGMNKVEKSLSVSPVNASKGKTR